MHTFHPRISQRMPGEQTRVQHDALTTPSIPPPPRYRDGCGKRHTLVQYTSRTGYHPTALRALWPMEIDSNRPSFEVRFLLRRRGPRYPDKDARITVEADHVEVCATVDERRMVRIDPRFPILHRRVHRSVDVLGALHPLPLPPPPHPHPLPLPLPHFLKQSSARCGRSSSK